MNTPATARPHQPQPRARSPLPLIAAFLLGTMATALWFHRQSSPAAANPVAGLSDSAKTALAGLPAPVTIHYYSLLAGNAGGSLQDFAGRARQLLDAMQDASGGKLHVLTMDVPAETNATAASSEGLQAFNLEKGEADFLGVAITSGKNKETMARLQPEYEPALESDLVRAILRVAVQPAPAAPAPEVARPSNEILASIHRLVPDVTATSADTANQIFHAEFLKELADAGAAMETDMQAAQQRVTTAQSNGASAELDAAQKNLAQVQLAQAEKVRQIAAELKTRQAVFENLKNTETARAN